MKKVGGTGAQGENFRMRFCSLFLAGALLAGVGRGEKPPTTDELMDAVLREPLSTTNPAVKSYEAEIVSMGLRASFWYTQPHRTALWVIDAQDGTPVMALADGKVAIYDPMASTVLLATNMYAGLQFTSKSSKEPGKSGVNFHISVQSDPTQAVGGIQLPRKIESTNFRAELQPMGEGRYQVRGLDTRSNPKTGETMTWTFTGLTDWPPREVPYRSLEIRGMKFLNLTVKSVNEPVAESCFQFPTQALLTSGLPVRQFSMEQTNEISQIAGMIMVNLNLRRALSLGDPQKAREALREVCRTFGQIDAGKEIDRLYGDSKSTEAMLAGMTPEQWESTRAKLYADLSREEFEKKRQDPAFRKELAEKIVAGMAQPMETGTGQGPTAKEYLKGMTVSLAEVAKSLDQIDVEALQAKDKKIAAQLRQAFQLEATAP